MLYAFLVSPIRATCPAHLILLDLISLIMFDEKVQVMKLLIMQFPPILNNDYRLRKLHYITFTPSLLITDVTSISGKSPSHFSNYLQHLHGLLVYSCCPHLEHTASVKRFVSFQFLNIIHSLWLHGRVISPSQGRYLTQTQNKHRHPYLEWDSNPRSQSSSERKEFMP
jgi:hypothetical protein